MCLFKKYSEFNATNIWKIRSERIIFAPAIRKTNAALLRFSENFFEVFTFEIWWLRKKVLPLHHFPP